MRALAPPLVPVGARSLSVTRRVAPLPTTVRLRALRAAGLPREGLLFPHQDHVPLVLESLELRLELDEENDLRDTNVL